MNASLPTGIFGKLPAHGDFLSRNLPTQFVNLWDSWLQGYVSSSQEQIGDNWLDVYLTSPIWRFALSPGVVDEKSWQGILLPSVDRVGRYFPFSVARPLIEPAVPAEAILQKDWYEAVEGAALSALEGARRIDDVLAELDALRVSGSPPYRHVEAGASALGTVISTADDVTVESAIPLFLHRVLKDTLRSYSIWSTAGSQLVAPCMFYSPGLPQRRGISAMLDGQWQVKGWQEPFVPLNRMG